MAIKSISKSNLLETLMRCLQQLKRYRVPIFLIVVAALYGFLVLQIGRFNNQQPSSDAISAQVNPITTAPVAPALVNQLKQLQNNSVTVKALFDQTRTNPFQD